MQTHFNDDDMGGRVKNSPRSMPAAFFPNARLVPGDVGNKKDFRRKQKGYERDDKRERYQ